MTRRLSGPQNRGPVRDSLFLAPDPPTSADAIHQHNQIALLLVKGVHSLIFLVLAAGVLETVRAGIRGKPSRLTGPAIAATLVEGAVLGLNQNHCPLTDLAVRFGSDHGEVSDIFLPRRVADHIPTIFTTLFGFGIGRLLEAAARKPRS